MVKMPNSNLSKVVYYLKFYLTCISIIRKYFKNTEKYHGKFIYINFTHIFLQTLDHYELSVSSI